MKSCLNFLKSLPLLRSAALVLLMGVVPVSQAAGSVLSHMTSKNCYSKSLLCWFDYPNVGEPVSDDLTSALGAVVMTASDTTAPLDDCMRQIKAVRNQPSAQSDVARSNPLVQTVSFSESDKPALTASASQAVKECLTDTIPATSATWILAIALVGFVSLSNKRRV